MRNVNKPLQIIRVESVNFKNNVAVVKHKRSHKEKYAYCNAAISGLLKLWLQNGLTSTKDGVYTLNKGDSLINQTYKSDPNSRDFALNPFRLVKFIPKKGSDIPESYRLELVFEKRSAWKEITDIYSEKYRKFYNRRMRPYEFVRSMLIEVDKKLKDTRIIVIKKGKDCKYNPVCPYDYELDSFAGKVSSDVSPRLMFRSRNPYRF